MANAAFTTDESTLYSRTAADILAEMASKGNKIATIRKNELDDLQALLAELGKRAEHSGLQVLTLATPEVAMSEPRQQTQTQFTDVQQRDSVRRFLATPEPSTFLSVSGDMQPPLPFQVEPLNNEFLDNLGISSYDFSNLVEQISHQDVTFSIPGS